MRMPLVTYAAGCKLSLGSDFCGPEVDVVSNSGHLSFSTKVYSARESNTIAFSFL